MQVRALNTVGLSRAALGDAETGIAMLRRSRDLAAQSGRNADHVQAVTNLSEVLDLTGRTREGLAEVEAAMEMLRANPERTSYDTFMELQGVNFLIKLGRLGELEHGLPAPKFGDAVGTTPIFLAELRARLALLTGELPEARRQLDEMRRLCLGTLDPQWMEPLHMLDAQIALLEDRPGDARDAVRRGLASLEGVEDGARIVRLAWTGLMVEATAAERARALAEPASEADAERLLAELEAAREMPGRWADAPAYEALALAEAGRLRVALGLRGARPRRLRAGRRGVRRARAALAGGLRGLPRRRGARAGRRPRRGRDAAARGARARRRDGRRAAAGRDRRAGAPRAARRRAPEAAGAEEAPESPADQLGLTPRELEVLLLVAAGRTNREIGAELFMSEKTASVHVSRILAKLGVGGRVEAAAVAHRLGITEPAASV